MPNAAIRALRPFAVAGYSARSGGPFGELADDAQIGLLCGVPIFAGDVRAAFETVAAQSPVRTIRQRRHARLKARIGFALSFFQSSRSQEAEENGQV